MCEAWRLGFRGITPRPSRAKTIAWRESWLAFSEVQEWQLEGPSFRPRGLIALAHSSNEGPTPNLRLHCCPA